VAELYSPRSILRKKVRLSYSYFDENNRFTVEIPFVAAILVNIVVFAVIGALVGVAFGPLGMLFGGICGGMFMPAWLAVNICTRTHRGYRKYTESSPTIRGRAITEAGSAIVADEVQVTGIVPNEIGQLIADFSAGETQSAAPRPR